MTLPPFELARPQSLTEACALLAETETEVIGGGTQLLFAMKNRTRAPRRLIDLDAIAGLDSIEETAAGLTIGARVTLAHLIEHPGVVRDYGVIAEAARLVATPQIQSMATVAGNLCQDTCCLYVDRALEQRDALEACIKLHGNICHVVCSSEKCWANYAGDLAPVLIALGATVTIVSAAGDEERDLRAIFSGKGERPIALAPGELIRSIHVPAQPARSGAAYLKLRQRQSLDYPLLGVAASVVFVDDAVRIRLVLTGVERGPVTVDATEKQISNDVMEKLAKTASRRVHPVKNAFGYGPSYRVRAIKPFTARAIRTAAERATGGTA